MALRNQPYFPLYVQDYLTDEKLNMCSASAQGVYIKILCILHKQEQYGCILFDDLFKQTSKQNFSIEEKFASVLSKQLCFEKEEISIALRELLHFKVLSLDEKGSSMFQARMKKDGDISEKRSLSAKKGGGNPNLNTKKSKDVLFKQISKQTPKQIPEYESEYESKDEIRKGVSKEGKQLIYPFDSKEFMEQWNIWKEYKSDQFKFKYKSKSTEQAQLTELSKLASTGTEAIAIMHQSIANGWKGLFELKANATGKQINPNTGEPLTATERFAQKLHRKQATKSFQA